MCESFQILVFQVWQSRSTRIWSPKGQLNLSWWEYGGFSAESEVEVVVPDELVDQYEAIVETAQTGKMVTAFCLSRWASVRIRTGEGGCDLVQNNLNLHRTLLARIAAVIILAGVKLAAEIVVPFLLSLFIAIIYSPIIKAMTQRRVPHCSRYFAFFCLDFFGIFFLVGLINSTAREFTHLFHNISFAFTTWVINWIVATFSICLSRFPRETIKKILTQHHWIFVSRYLNFSGGSEYCVCLVLVVILCLPEALRWNINLQW